MNGRDDLIEHLALFREMGIAGVRRDPEWRGRADASGDADPLSATPGGGEPRQPDAPRTLGPEPRLPAVAASLFDVPEAAAGTGTEVTETLDAVRADLGDCTRCKLHGLGRRQIVFGVGNPRAELMFVGEGPGHDEDVQGIPFVGRAGQLLTKIIEAINYRRDEVYIANVVKCRPPENRNPEPDEVATCRPFLLRQIAAIRPRVIVALGSVAAQALLETRDPISRLRGRVYLCGGARLIATFHPAYLLRSPERKRDTWEDMKKVRGLLQGDDV